MQQRVIPSGHKRPDGSLEAHRMRRRGLRLFAVIFLLFCCSIAVAVLTADDQRRLKQLIESIGEVVHWQSREEPEPTVLRGKRLPSGQTPSEQVMVPARFFDVPPLLDIAAPVRKFRVSGKTLCAQIKTAGLGAADWVQNPFSPGTFNCIAETSLPAAKPDGDAPSFFMVVRGTPDGQITQIRIKVIEVKSSQQIWQRYDAALDLILNASRWPDFAGDFDRMRSLEPFEANHFGISLKFTKEFMGPERYNIIFMPEDDGELERRTRVTLNAQPSLKTAPLTASFWPRQVLGGR
ncbi:DUF6030 family protein [Agrobacterium vitis]|uniref:DUF6030 family protein n=1 Tax=Agrobacterium vitis TaxID=373 RepID=UPI003D275792